RVHERFDERINFRFSAQWLRGDGLELFGDLSVHLPDDGRVERRLAGKVVVNHRLVDAGAAGDAIDGGRRESTGAELVARRGENAAAGAGQGGGSGAARSDHR